MDVHRGNVYSATCPCRALLDVVANKWSALIIDALGHGPLRFNELHRKLGGITPKVLIATLRRLEDFDLVNRAIFAEVPARVEYSLTLVGKSSLGPVAALRAWAESQYDMASAHVSKRNTDTK